MKKVFTLLTLALLSIGTAWADPTPGEANSTYLDISKYATITTAGFTSSNNTTTIYAYNETTNWLTIYGYGAQQSTGNQKWITKDSGTNTGDEQWSATDVFKGGAAYSTKETPKVSCLRSNLHYSFKVTACEEVRALVKVRNSGKSITLTVYEINADGTRKSETPVGTATENTRNAVKVMKVTGLDGAKIYEAHIVSSHETNEFLYEIAFKKADNRSASTLEFATTSGSADIHDGRDFSLPALTKTPSDMTVTYSSNAPGIAKVNETTGAVSLIAAGTAKITASYAGNATYKPATATYTLTVTNSDAISEAATITWAFSSGATGQSASYNAEIEDCMKSNKVTIGSNLSYTGTQSGTTSDSETFTETKLKSASNEASAGESNAVKFLVRVKQGYTFTPTNVSFVATRCGTNGGKMTMSWVDSENTTVQLGTAAASSSNSDPARNSNSPSATKYAYNLSTNDKIKKTTGEFGLMINVYSTDREYAFGNVVITGTIEGSEAPVTKYDVVVSVADGQSAYGTVDFPGTNKLDEEDNFTIKATANTGYKFVNWTIDGVAQNANPYTFENITANHTAVANFKQLKSISFAAGDGTGEVPALEYADEGEQYTVPKSYFLKKDGYTLTGWSDGVNTYAAGDKITIASSNITLTAVFAANTQSLDARANDVTVTWDFQKKNIGLFTPSSGYFVAKANVNGENIDVPMAFDKSIPNASWNDWANTGNKPTLTIPAAKGMTITMLTFSSPSTSTIAGTTSYTVTGSNNPYTVSYTYEGSANTIDIYLADADYIRTLTAVYPANVAFATIGSTGYATLYTTKALDFSAATPAGLTASTITLNGAKTEATPTAVSDVPANTGVMLQGTTGTTYTIPVIASSETAKGDLTGSADATAADGTQYVLAKPNEKELGFYKATSGSIAAGKAFLSIPQNAPEFILFNLGSETTDINAVKGAEPKVNGQVFDLQGRKVAQPTKGLYIVNGKKMVIK